MAYSGTAKNLFSSLISYAHLRFPCLFYTHLVLFPCLFCICAIRMLLYYLSLIINYLSVIINYQTQIILYHAQIILYHAQIIRLYTYQNNAERLRKESEYGDNEVQYVCFSSFMLMSYGRLWVVYILYRGAHNVLLMCESVGRLVCFEAQSIKNPAPQLWNGKSYL